MHNSSLRYIRGKSTQYSRIVHNNFSQHHEFVPKNKPQNVAFYDVQCSNTAKNETAPGWSPICKAHHWQWEWEWSVLKHIYKAICVLAQGLPRRKPYGPGWMQPSGTGASFHRSPRSHGLGTVPAERGTHSRRFAWLGACPACLLLVLSAWNHEKNFQ